MSSEKAEDSVMKFMSELWIKDRRRKISVHMNLVADCHENQSHMIENTETKSIT